MMSLRRGIMQLVTVLTLATAGCHLNRHPAEPTQVARGLRFVSNNAAFDAFFADLHEAQLDMLRMPELERSYRKDLAKVLKIDEGATAALLAEHANTVAQALATKGTTLKLDTEGVEAVDEADTSAQMRVNGNLDGDNLHIAESITRTARSELKLLAHLNAKGQSLQRLAERAAILEDEADRAFAGSDSAKLDLVHRNLSDAKLLISLMDEKRVELSLEARRIVERLAFAVTTNPALGAPNEPPLVTFVKAAPNPDKEKANKAKPGGAPANPRGGTTKSPTEAAGPSTDFEP